MTTDDNSVSGIWRNIGTIERRRCDLRATEALVGETQGAASNAPLGPPANVANAETMSERMTARVAEVFDRFGEAVVADITNAARRTAMLRTASATAAKPPERDHERSSPPKDAVDVDFVEVEPGTPSGT